MDDDITEMRIYEDHFPNELSSKFELSSYAELIYNDYGDDDDSTYDEIYAPSMANASSVYYSQDHIPVSFDTNTIIGGGDIEVFNILEESVELSIPGLYSEFTGIDSADIDLDAIIVIPRNGKVIYDSNPKSVNPTTDGYYIHYDSDKDGVYETIFVADEDGNILSVCFDYDMNKMVTPNLFSFVEFEGIQWSGGNAKESLAQFIPWRKLEDENYGLVPEFSDSMFDLWKIQYTDTTSQLITETEEKTADELIGYLTGRFTEDYLFQIFAQSCGLVGGAIGSVAGHPHVGYAIGYFIPSILKSLREHQDQEQFIKSQQFFNEDYEGEITLSTRHFLDIFGDLPTEAIFGSFSSVYVDVKGHTKEHDYTGKMILAPYGQKTEAFTGRVLPITLNYELKTRDNWAYSDDFFVGGVFRNFINNNFGGEAISSDIYIDHRTHNIMYLESEIYDQSGSDNPSLDTVVPSTFAGIPLLQFTQDTEYGVSLPKFFMDYPIVVSEDVYNDLNQMTEFNEYFSIYKFYNPLIPNLSPIS